MEKFQPNFYSTFEEQIRYKISQFYHQFNFYSDTLEQTINDRQVIFVYSNYIFKALELLEICQSNYPKLLKCKEIKDFKITFTLFFVKFLQIIDSNNLTILSKTGAGQAIAIYKIADILNIKYTKTQASLNCITLAMLSE
jgi:hypothetical protein